MDMDQLFVPGPLKSLGSRLTQSLTRKVIGTEGGMLIPLYDSLYNRHISVVQIFFQVTTRVPQGNILGPLC